MWHYCFISEDTAECRLYEIYRQFGLNVEAVGDCFWKKLSRDGAGEVKATGHDDRLWCLGIALLRYGSEAAGQS